VTLAVQAGITDHIWGLHELIGIEMDSSNLRGEQKEALAQAINIIETICAGLKVGMPIPDATNELNEARNKVNSVLSGDRSRELGVQV
jgi:hypothetical protein